MQPTRQRSRTRRRPSMQGKINELKQIAFSTEPLIVCKVEAAECDYVIVLSLS